MKQTFRSLFAVMALALLAAMPTLATAQGAVQSPTNPQPLPGGQYVAELYNYGGQPSTIAPDPLFVDIGNSATGTQAITVRVNAYIKTIGGDVFMPLATNAPITIDSGGNQETVTPTSVSCSTPQVPGTCVFVASFTLLHGSGARIASGTQGFQEAANRAMLSGGGMVVLDQSFVKAGGAATGLPSNVSLSGSFTGLGPGSGFTPNVIVEDRRNYPLTYWAVGPNTTTTVTTPSAPTNAIASGGSLTTGNYLTAVECVDPVLGFSLPSTDSSTATTTSGNQTITLTPPTMPTGCVAYIPMITAAGGSSGTEIEVPVTSSVCTLSQLTIAGKNTCAAGAVATITTNPSSTAKEVTLATAHTTFAPKQYTSLPGALCGAQTVFLPFSQVATVTSTASTIAQVFVPAGCLNSLGKEIDMYYKIAGTEAATAVPTFTVLAANQFGQSPVTLATIAYATQTGAVTWDGGLSFTTAATGSSGTLWAKSLGSNGQSLNATQSTSQAEVEVTTAVSSTLDLTKGIYLYIQLASATANTTSVTVNNLSFRTPTS